MSGPYWDVRTCSWQGVVEAASPIWTAAQDRPPVVDSVPAQATATEAEVLPSARTPA